MKKLLSVICAVLVIFGAFSVTALAAEPYSAGISVLKSQFSEGVGPKTENFAIDYLYFSPVKEADSEKYPLVIWLHGMWDGSYSGRQIRNNNIAYWTSEEFQSRFPSGGAFLMVPRSPEEEFIYWEDRMVYPLRAAIDDFIAQNEANVDISRIYIGGYSMGGKMTLKMITAYPEMFAAAFPICPAWSPDEDSIALFKDIPMWLTCGTTDNMVSYDGVSKTWDKFAAITTKKAESRFSSLARTLMPDGSDAPSAHESWQAVAHDMFSSQWGAYPEMTTVNALGEEVIITYPDGMISWLSQFTSDYDGSAATDSGNIDVKWSGTCIGRFVRGVFGTMFVTMFKVLDRLTDSF